MILVEFSPTQQCFHVDDIERSLKANYEMFRKRPQDESDWYIPIFKCETREEASIFCNTHRHLLKKVTYGPL